MDEGLLAARDAAGKLVVDQVVHLRAVFAAKEEGGDFDLAGVFTGEVGHKGVGEGEGGGAHFGRVLHHGIAYFRGHHVVSALPDRAVEKQPYTCFQVAALEGSAGSIPCALVYLGQHFGPARQSGQQGLDRRLGKHQRADEVEVADGCVEGNIAAVGVGYYVGRRKVEGGDEGRKVGYVLHHGGIIVGG